MANWIFVGGVALLMAIVAAGTLHSGLLLRRWTPPFNIMLSLPDNLARCLMVGLCLLLGGLWGPGSDALGWRTASLPSDLAVGAGVGLAASATLNLAGLLVIRRWGTEVYSTRLLQCILPINRREWIGVLLALFPAAALEELLFRSLPLGGMGQLGPALLSPAFLMWPLSLFFGLLHWPQGGWGIVGTALASVILSLLFLATGSFWAVLSAHYALNVAQIISARLIGIRPLRSSASPG